MSERIGLCFRCEWRALFLEKEMRPRYECGVIKEAKVSCYMFKPIQPVILAPLDRKDKRPRFAGAMISSREQVCGLAENFELGTHKGNKKDEVILYWKPKDEKTKKV